MNLSHRFQVILVVALLALFFAFPDKLSVHQQIFNRRLDFDWQKPQIKLAVGEKILWQAPVGLRQGLGLAGGMQVTLKRDVNDVPIDQRETALSASREVISRRVDLFGVGEPEIYSLVANEDYRIVVELPGLDDPQKALDLIGSTARLDFRTPVFETATDSAEPILNDFEPSSLSGKDLKTAQVSFQSQSSQPVVAITFTDQGRDKFAQITEVYQGQPLAIFLDDQFLTAPIIQAHITAGEAVIEGDFDTAKAKQL